MITNYKLIVHDKANLAIQEILSDESKDVLEKASENLNNLFNMSGYSETFEAEYLHDGHIQTAMLKIVREVIVNG